MLQLLCEDELKAADLLRIRLLYYSADVALQILLLQIDGCE